MDSLCVLDVGLDVTAADGALQGVLGSWEHMGENAVKQGAMW